MAKFKPNRAAIEALGNSAPVRKVVKQKTEDVKTYVQAYAPVRSGAYKESWRIVPLASGGFSLVSDDWKAWFIEKGVRPHGDNAGFQAMHVVQKALDSVGGDQ